MKKLTIILSIACMTFFALQTQAQGTIRLTWRGSTSEKTIKVRATAGTGNIIVDWGKGNTQMYNGVGDDKDVSLSYTYGDTNTYNVIIAVPANTALTQLDCSSNRLIALDVSNNTALTSLLCYSNQLTALDLSNNTALTSLNCNYTQLTALDISNSTALAQLNCYYNRLTALDISNNTALTKLDCSYNQLTTLDVSNNTALRELYCYYNKLTALDLSNNTALTYLSCGDNQLTALDLSNNTALTYLNCMNNGLITLDVSNNTALTELNCSYVQLTSLDISNNTALTELNCGSNQLTALDLSNNTALTDLDCCENRLKALDVSNNTVLTGLRCYSTRLTTLDLSNNTALIDLDCSYNRLTTLDVSNNTVLTGLRCNSNRLPLSQLYPLWNKVMKRFKILSPQNIYDTIVVNKTIDLSSELEFGSPAVPTQFTVTMRDNSSAEGNYTFENGELIFTASGDYKVVMQNDSVRTGTSAAGDEAVTLTAYYHVEKGGTSIEEIENNNSISIYPNPSNGQLTIDNGQGIIEDIAIYDISGRTVETWHAAPLQTIDISHLSNGIYLLKVKTTEGGEVVRKVIKE